MIGRISPQGDVTTYDTGKHIPGNNVGVIAPLTDGSVWIFTELSLGRISTDGTIKVLNVTPLADHLVTSGATDAAGNLWIIGGLSQGIGGIVVRYTPDGSWKVWSFSTLLTDASGGIIMTVRGRDGNLWTVGNGTLLRTTPDGAVKAYELPGNLIVGSLTVDADNNFWVTEPGAYTIIRIHLGGS
jgi:streptogramin lyase